MAINSFVDLKVLFIMPRNINVYHTTEQHSMTVQTLLRHEATKQILWNQVPGNMKARLDYFSKERLQGYLYIYGRLPPVTTFVLYAKTLNIHSEMMYT